MKRTRMVALLIVLAMPLGMAFSKDKSSKGGTEDQITKLEDQMREGALKNDAKVLEDSLADDYIGISPVGKETTKTEAIELRKNGTVKYDSIEVSDRKVRVYGNTAIVTLHGDVKGNAFGQDISGPYRVSRVWVKQGGKWKVVAFQSSRIQEQPAK